jgi:hypothetical protein
MPDLEFLESLPPTIQVRLRAVQVLHAQLTSEEGWGKNVYPTFWDAHHKPSSHNGNLPGQEPNSPALSDLAYLIRTPQIADILWPSERIIVTAEEGPMTLAPGTTYSTQVADRNSNFVFLKYGFASEPQTYKAIADAHSLTRQRVQQIVAREINGAYETFSSTPPTHIPVLHAITMLLVEMVKARSGFRPDPTSSSSDSAQQRTLTIAGALLISDYLTDLHLVSSPLQIIAIMTWYRDLIAGYAQLMRFRWPSYQELTLFRVFDGSWFAKALFGKTLISESNVVDDILISWRDLIAAFKAPLPERDAGAAHAIKMIKSRGALEVSDKVKRQNTIKYLRDQGHKILESSNWVIRLDDTRNTLRDGIGRLLTMIGPLPISHIRDGISATKPGRKEYALDFSEQDLTSVLQETKWCTFLDGRWHWAGNPVEVGKKDKEVYDALACLPPVFFYYEAVKATENICSVANLSFFLKGPYGFSPKHNMYCLRGTEYNAFDLARSLPQGTVAHAKANSYFVSHEPDIMHVDAPDNWNSQVSVGLFYDGDWTIAHGTHTRPGKARNGVLFSGLLPILKVKQVGKCFDLTFHSEMRVIRVAKCARNAPHAAKDGRNGAKPPNNLLQRSPKTTSFGPAQSAPIGLWESPGLDSGDDQPTGTLRHRQDPTAKPATKAAAKPVPKALMRPYAPVKGAKPAIKRSSLVPISKPRPRTTKPDSGPAVKKSAALSAKKPPRERPTSKRP